MDEAADRRATAQDDGVPSSCYEGGRRGGDVAKNSDMWDPHVPHQQNHQQNSFDVVKGRNLAGIESLGM